MRNNPVLAALQPLVGGWRAELYNAAILPAPDSRATMAITIDWIEEGAALVMRQGDSAQPRPRSGSSAATRAGPNIRS